MYYRFVIPTFLLFVLLCQAGFISGQSEEWEKFTDLDGHFSVYTPGTPEHNTRIMETELGEITYHTFYYQPQVDFRKNEMYMISYCDYPEEAVHSDSIQLLDDFFAATIETAVESVQGELLYKSENSVFGYPGWLWRIRYMKGQVFVKTQAFLAENRYYAIQVVTRKDLSLNPDIDRFMGSFRLINQ